MFIFGSSKKIAMRFLLPLLMIISLLSCNESSELEKQLSGCDSLEINFNESGTNRIMKTVTTTEKNAIKKLIHFVNGNPSTANQCNYDGNLMFHRDGKLIGDFSFNYTGDSCRYFIQEQKGSLLSSKMSNEAVTFLKSLAEGNSWY